MRLAVAALVAALVGCGCTSTGQLQPKVSHDLTLACDALVTAAPLVEYVMRTRGISEEEAFITLEALCEAHAKGVDAVITGPDAGAKK